MTHLSNDAFIGAARFVDRNARLIDRYRFARLFTGGPAQPVLTALRAYANPDGGFGNALEPDLRGAGSQPQPVEVALHLLDELDRFDEPMVPAACDYLATISTDDGGVPFVLPGARDTACAWWWRMAAEAHDDPPASINPTGPIAGILAAHHVDHPWLPGAVRYCWRRLDDYATSGEEIAPYDARAAVLFLDRIPDAERARATLARLRDQMLAGVSTDPHAEGHVQRPLDCAPEPGRPSAALFAPEVIDAALDRLIDIQQADGGWNVDFELWAPATGPEWRGSLTVDTLRILRAYGRFPH